MVATDSVQVEYDLRPAYYDDFRCLMGKCRFNCCKDGWHIPFDKKAYMRLKDIKGSSELNACMNHCLRRIRSGSLAGTFYGEFRLKDDGDCPLQREDGLCLLQLEKGQEALPAVCQNFPRVEGPHLSGYLERALSPGCEAVLELLWNLPEGVDFRSDPLPEPMMAEMSARQFDSISYAFQDVRSQCIDILQDRRMPLPQRIILLGLALKSIVDGERDTKHWIEQVQLLSEQVVAGGVPMVPDHERALPQYIINCLQILRSITTQNLNFQELRRELMDALDVEWEKDQGSFSVESYLTARSCYEERFGDKDYFMENLMVSLFFQLRLPTLDSIEILWREYVAFCNLYGFFRFLAVMSCRTGVCGDKKELFRALIFGSRGLVHDIRNSTAQVDVLFRNESATLAHMAVLLSN